MRFTKNLTQAQLKRILSYSPETGSFTWRVTRNHLAKAGTEAGHHSESGYVQIRVLGTFHYAHRLAWLYMTGKWPKGLLDHINQSRGDNRWENLREATAAQNVINGKVRKDNTSGIRGVCWAKVPKAWLARLYVDGKQVHLGYFADLQDAARAYRSAARRHYAAFSSAESGR